MKTVLYVCVHNAGRSQMAAGLVKLRSEGRIGVRSAGSVAGEEINPTADFFEIGGNSLAAVQLASRISAHFGIELGVGSLFDHSTVDALAAEIAVMLDASRVAAGHHGTAG